MDEKIMINNSTPEEPKGQELPAQIPQEGNKTLFDRMYDAIWMFKSCDFKGDFKLEYTEGALTVIMTIGEENLRND